MNSPPKFLQHYTYGEPGDETAKHNQMVVSNALNVRHEGTPIYPAVLHDTKDDLMVTTPGVMHAGNYLMSLGRTSVTFQRLKIKDQILELDSYPWNHRSLAVDEFSPDSRAWEEIVPTVIKIVVPAVLGMYNKTSLS